MIFRTKIYLLLVSVVLLAGASLANPVAEPDGPRPSVLLTRILEKGQSAAESAADTIKKQAEDTLKACSGQLSTAEPTTSAPDVTSAPPPENVTPAADKPDAAYVGEPFLYGYAGDEPVFYYPSDLDDAMLEDATYYYTRNTRDAKLDDNSEWPSMACLPSTEVLNKKLLIEYNMAWYLKALRERKEPQGQFVNSDYSGVNCDNLNLEGKVRIVHDVSDENHELIFLFNYAFIFAGFKLFLQRSGNNDC